MVQPRRLVVSSKQDTAMLGKHPNVALGTQQEVYPDGEDTGSLLGGRDLSWEWEGATAGGGGAGGRREGPSRFYSPNCSFQYSLLKSL